MARSVWLLILLCQSVFCDDCVTYDFEHDFYNIFTSDIAFCSRLAPWKSQQYSAVYIVSPHVRSSSFISPSTGISSCVSSYNFNISRGGIVEVDIFMGEKSANYHFIQVHVQRYIPGQALGATVGLVSYNPELPNFVPGWKTLRVELSSFDSAEGYIIFTGRQTDYVVIVDAFRYIPPDYDGDCLIYKDSVATTIEPTTPDCPQSSKTDPDWTQDSTTNVNWTQGTTTDTDWTQDTTTDNDGTQVSTTNEDWTKEATIVPDWTQDTTTNVDWTQSTTTNSDWSQNTTIETSWLPSTTSAGQNLHCTDCVTYDFEQYFENLFIHNSGKCTDMSPWKLQQYASVDIAHPHNSSQKFISATVTRPVAPSCVSSFPFGIANSGVLEVNVSMDVSSQVLDYISVLVMSKQLNGSESVVGRLFHSPLLPSFVPGWTTLRHRIDAPAGFQGYIIITGMTTNSTLSVDSFRYIPPNCDEDQCVIYENTTWTISETTTTSDPWNGHQ